MWDDSRAALGDLDLGGRTRILDVGCGTGEFTRVLAEASEARVVGVDADTDLLSVASDRDSDIETVAGDATRLPFAAGSFDLVVCQALLVNLSVVGTRRYHHRKLTEPPYDDHDVRSAAKKATGEGLDRHEADLRRGLDDDSYESVRREWREMGREVVQQIRDGEYRRAEVVPFDVTTGRV